MKKKNPTLQNRPQIRFELLQGWQKCAMDSA